AIELFGPSLAPYATIACIISFLMTGHRSVYPSQILSIKKSESLQVEIGKELETVRATYAGGNKKLFSLVLQALKRIETFLKR
ncbi:MAG TPA: voltage-gated chloride channel, partial [Bacteroidota bacterium]|nr:voltage-gated chloride channel [Bacteroidota bacterium]